MHLVKRPTPLAFVLSFALVAGFIAPTVTSAAATTVTSSSLSDGQAGAVVLSAKKTARPKVRRVLIVPVQWSGAKSDSKGVRQTKKDVAAANTYVRAVSAGRVGFKVSKTLQPVKIARPKVACQLNFSSFQSQTMKALAKKKIKTSGYDNIIVRTPAAYCTGQPGLSAGIASLGGSWSVLFGQPHAQVLTHELGHNLGLPHGNSLTCKTTKKALATLTASATKRCNVYEYGDNTDIMGTGGWAWLPTPQLARLGWIRSAQMRTFTSVAKKKTSKYTLVPTASTKSGVKSVRVKVSRSRTYWIEYRTNSGQDRSQLPPGATGVQVRIVDTSIFRGAMRGAMTLDMLPGGTGGSALPIGESWTSPEGIRIQVTSATSQRAKVTVTSRRPKAAKPKPVTALQATPAMASATGLGTSSVSWKRGRTTGAPVSRYEIDATNLRTGKSTVKRISAAQAAKASTKVSGLIPGDTYQLRVRSLNEVGVSRWSPSVQVTTVDDAPNVTITSPSPGARVSDDLAVSVAASPNSKTGSAIVDVQITLTLYNLGGYSESSFSRWPDEVSTGNYRVTLPAKDWRTSNGSVKGKTYKATITATATDARGRVKTTTRPITVLG